MNLILHPDPSSTAARGARGGNRLVEQLVAETPSTELLVSGNLIERSKVYIVIRKFPFSGKEYLYAC